MIRGAIEIAEPTRVAGWIVSSATPLRGLPVLAFSGAVCVGAGTVEVFRRDLLMANLGDGYAGFDFPIALSTEQDLASVVIRLENCDAAILQSGTAIVRKQVEAAVQKQEAAVPSTPSKQAAGKILAMARV